MASASLRQRGYLLRFHVRDWGYVSVPLSSSKAVSCALGYVTGYLAYVVLVLRVSVSIEPPLPVLPKAMLNGHSYVSVPFILGPHYGRGTDYSQLL